jgi:hypothetical protein
MPKIQNNRKDAIKSVFITDYYYLFYLYHLNFIFLIRIVFFLKILFFNLKKKRKEDIDREIVY